MTLILKQFFSFIKLLHSDTGFISLSLGCVCGFILGMTPTLSLQSLLVFLLLFVFRIQIGAALLTAFFFKFVAFLLDPAFDSVGQWALEIPSMQSLYTSLYNMPLVPFTRFNNSIVMGSAIITILLSPFVYLLSAFLIKKYRESVVEKFKETKAFKLWKATSLYKWYFKYDQFFGN